MDLHSPRLVRCLLLAAVSSCWQLQHRQTQIPNPFTTFFARGFQEQCISRAPESSRTFRGCLAEFPGRSVFVFGGRGLVVAIPKCLLPGASRLGPGQSASALHNIVAGSFSCFHHQGRRLHNSKISSSISDKKHGDLGSASTATARSVTPAAIPHGAYNTAFSLFLFQVADLHIPENGYGSHPPSCTKRS